MSFHPPGGPEVKNNVRHTSIRTPFRVLAVTVVPALFGYVLGGSIRTSHAKASWCGDVPTIVLVEVERSTSPDGEWVSAFPPTDEIELLPSHGEYHAPDFWALPYLIRPDIKLGARDAR